MSKREPDEQFVAAPRLHFSREDRLPLDSRDTGPSGVLDQSMDRMSAPILPPPANTLSMSF
ncbi:MAG TPA: hypothetical protein VF267_08755 [Gammaproteobacteria bacterium]